MKSHILWLFCLLLLMQRANAQSQRLVLMEEFTGENCPPCGTYNPAFNALLDSHAGKIVSIKYQVDIPFGSPPLFSYNKPEVNAASDYYSIVGAPTGQMDGNTWSGGVSSFTAAQIDSRFAVPSPFSVQVSHEFSSVHDMIHTRTVIRATEALSGLTQLRAKIAVTEKEINGPATFNGETHWQHVMRKLLPGFGGIALPADWAVGDSVVLDEAWTIAQPPSPSAGALPNWMQLEVVSFVQNDETKEVLQTGFSPALVTTAVLDLGEKAEPLAIFPNPTDGQIQFVLPEKMDGKTDWQITDALGKQVASGKFTNGKAAQTLDVHALPSGVYWLTLHSTKTVFKGNFVKN